MISGVHASRIPHHVPHGPAATEGESHAPGAATQAFSLVEILTTIALLSFIILGLFAMFNQVQRAFRTSMNQVDQLEAGRAVTEMLPRELEQFYPSGFPGLLAVNFYSQILDSTPLTQFVPSTTTPGTTVLRTDLLADCFFLMRQNQTWVGVGYCVRTNDIKGRLWLPLVLPGQLGVGSLYRYQASLPVLYPYGDSRSGLPTDPSVLFAGFKAAIVPGSAASLNISNRICDGVIHFRFRAFNTNGVLITLPLRPFSNPPLTTIQWSAVAPGEIGLYQFNSNAVPASLEMELGILEQHALDRYLAIGVPAAQLNYLRSADYFLSSRVHLFRQRIPVRNVDPSAYQ